MPDVMPALAERLGGVFTSASVRMTVKANELHAHGVEVIQLTLGEPDFPTAPHAIEAAHQAALNGDTKYPPQDGTPALKAAIRRKFRRDNGLDFGADEICVSNGGSQAIFNAFVATLDRNDQVVIPVPAWTPYPMMVKLVGGKPVFVPCAQHNDFKPRVEELDAAITRRTKWLVLINPNNPSGAACTAEELRAIAAMMRQHPHVWIMCDDVYEHLIFDGHPHASLAAVAPDLRGRLLIVSGVSKTYAMTGWRIGFAAGPKALIRAMVNIQGHTTAGVSTVGQAAAAAVLDGPQDCVAEHLAVYRRRRDLVVDRLNACKGVNCHRPQGAFYVFPHVAGCIGKRTAGGARIRNDEDFALALLAEGHVAVVPGAAYGLSPYVRISTATGDDVLTEGCRRIAAFCGALH
jgi:aspartate aminotransferase